MLDFSNDIFGIRCSLAHISVSRIQSRLPEEQFPRLGCSTPVGDLGLSPKYSTESGCARRGACTAKNDGQC